MDQPGAMTSPSSTIISFELQAHIELKMDLSTSIQIKHV